MSTNPNTKTYWYRVERIGKKLSRAVQYGHIVIRKKGVIKLDEPIPLYELGRMVDPEATDRMIQDALRWAIEDAKESIGYDEKRLAEDQEGLSRLEALTTQVRRARLKVVPPTMRRTK